MNNAHGVKRHQPEENLGAAELTLSKEDMHKITQALETINIVGERYPAALQAA